MQMTGSCRIPAPRDRVWAALNDADVLKGCIPGCESIEKLSDTRFDAVVIAKVGPVKATFTGRVTLSDLDSPNGYTISGEGTGGAAGFAKGGARVRLAEDDGGTLLSYEVEAMVGGKLAQVGSRLVDGTARKFADDFFARFAEAMGAAEAPAPEAPPQPPPKVPAAPADAPAAAGGIPRWVWIAAAAAVLVLLALAVGRDS